MVANVRFFDSNTRKMIKIMNRTKKKYKNVDTKIVIKVREKQTVILNKLYLNLCKYKCCSQFKLGTTIHFTENLSLDIQFIFLL